MSDAPDPSPVERAQRAFDALIHAAHAYYAHRRRCPDSGTGGCADCATKRDEHRRAKRLYDTAIVHMLGGPEEPPPPSAPAAAAALPLEETGTC